MEYWNQLSSSMRALLIGAMIAVFGVSGFILYPHYLKNEASNRSSERILLPNEPVQISVYVTGAVDRPGVYTLPHGSRVKDVLSIAKPKKEWDPEGINLAKRLEDEEMIVVPRVVHETGATAAQGVSGSRSPAQNSKKKISGNEKVSVNKAGLADLQSIPGVGPGMAKRIIDYRLAHGTFGSIEDLKDIPGMGEKKFEKLKGHFRL